MRVICEENDSNSGMSVQGFATKGSNPCYTRLVITNQANGPFRERAKTNTKQNDKRLRVAVLKLTIRCLEASKFFTIVQVNLVPS